MIVQCDVYLPVQLFVVCVSKYNLSLDKDLISKISFKVRIMQEYGVHRTDLHVKDFLWTKTFHSLIAKNNISFYRAYINNNTFSFN